MMASFRLLKSNLFDFLRFEWSRDHVSGHLIGWYLNRFSSSTTTGKSVKSGRYIDRKDFIEKIKNRLYADWIVERYFYLTIEDFIDQVGR